MKNKLLLTFFLCILITCSAIYFYFSKDSITLTYTNNTLALEITQDNTDEIIYPFYNEKEDTYIFFLPAYAKDFTISLNSAIHKNMFINNSSITSSHLLYDENAVYVFRPENASCEEYHIKFLCSDNIPSLFLTLGESELHYIYDSHSHFATADITLINAAGNTEYSGTLESISCRGNSTNAYEKKPFSIKFNNSLPLCGLAPSSKWVLLANWRDASKIQNKLTYSIANILDLKYTPRGTWVDLYLNGDYRGNYLLSSPITVDEDNVNIHNLEKQNRVLNPDIEQATTFETETMKGYNIKSNPNITGGYIIEKDFSVYYESERNGFITDEGLTFTIKHPKPASYEQVNYIYNYIQTLENMILNKDENLSNYLDFDSYSKVFLINEICMDYDTGITSKYFYKDINDNVLYSGPVWDYDYAYGVPDFPKWNNYTTSLLDCELTWNKHLYENTHFFNILAENFTKVLPELEYLISSEINTYANYISKSVSMDRLRWQKYSKNSTTYSEKFYHGHYYSYDSTIEYLKYFLINRINHLINLWNIDYPALKFESPKQLHTVSFKIDDETIYQQTIQHGTPITSLPELPSELYSNWYLLPREELYTEYLPILEDAVLIAK